MATETSRLIVELLDRVSEPARRAASALTGITRATREQNQTPLSFQERLDGAIARNNRALANARSGLIDAAAGFYALRAAISGPVSAAMDFESAMADVTKVVDFDSPEALEAFQMDLMELSREIPVAVNGLADIAAAAGQAGIAGEDLVRFTDAAARVGTAFDITAAEAGTSMAHLRTGLGLSIDETVLLADAMNHLSNSQASTAAQIMDVMLRVGAQAQTYGLAADDTAALASAMIAAGAESNVAATSIRNMGRALTRGESATARQADAFDALGLSATDVAARMQTDATGTILDVLERLQQVPAEMRAAVTSDLFGDEARALGPLLTNLDLVRDSLGLVGDENEYAGSAFAEAERRMDTFGGALTTFRNQITEVGVALGDALIPRLEATMDAIRPVLEAVAAFVRNNEGLTAAIFSTTSAVIGLRVALAAFRYLGLLGKGGVLSLISGGLRMIGATAIPLGRAVGESVRLQRTLAAMSGLNLGFLGTVRAALSGIAGLTGLSGVTTAFSAFAGVLATVSAPVWLGIAAAVAAIAAAGLLLRRYWDRITAIVSGVAGAIGDRLAPVIERMQPLFDALAPVVNLVTAAFTGLRNILQGVVEWVGNVFDGLFEREVLSEEERAAVAANAADLTNRIIDALLGLPARLLELGRNAIQGLWDGMVQKFEELLEWVRGIPGRITEAVGNINLRSLVGAGGGDEITTFNPITGERAAGGPISRGSRYLVGEEGPEVITASRSGYVHPNGTEGGGPSISVSPSFHFSGMSAADADAISERVRTTMRDEVREMFRGVYSDTGMRFA